jgi:MFS family permease
MPDSSPRTAAATSATDVRAAARPRWRIAMSPNGIAAGSALLWLYAAWAPWVVVSGSLLQRTPIVVPLPYADPPALAGLTGAHGLASALQPGTWGALTPLGLLICPWLWWPRARAVAASAFALWVAICTVLATVAAVALLGLLPANRLHLVPPGTDDALLDFGLLLALIALAAAWWASIALLTSTRRVLREHGRRAPSPDEHPAGEAPRPPERTWMAANGPGIFTGGVVIWAAGYLFMPWALAPCGGAGVFAICSGVSAQGAMEVAAAPAAWLLDPLVFVYAVPVLLIGGTLLAVIGVYRAGLSGRLCVWMALWLALATATVALGLAGTAQVAAHGGSGATSDLSAYPAGVVATLGLVIAWIGEALLGIALYMRFVRQPDRR